MAQVTDDLKRRQEAGERVEKAMLHFLMQFTPASELKISDARCIASFARSSAFDEFNPEKDSSNV